MYFKEMTKIATLINLITCQTDVMPELHLHYAKVFYLIFYEPLSGGAGFWIEKAGFFHIYRVTVFLSTDPTRLAKLSTLSFVLKSQ